MLRALCTTMHWTPQLKNNNLKEKKMKNKNLKEKKMKNNNLYNISWHCAIMMCFASNLPTRQHQQKCRKLLSPKNIWVILVGLQLSVFNLFNIWGKIFVQILVFVGNISFELLVFFWTDAKPSQKIDLILFSFSLLLYFSFIIMKWRNIIIK